MKKYNIAIIGATGLVGSTFLKVMDEKNIDVSNLYLYASKKSEGKIINYRGKDYIVKDIEKYSDEKVDFALFSAGASISKEYAKKFIDSGAIVIDNSSYFRMDENSPLIVPEINFNDRVIGNLIANPNCSTITAILPLYHLDKEFDLIRVNYTTYQAVSGSGIKGINDYKRCLNGEEPKFYPYDITKTCIPEIDIFDQENHYTKEELKMVNETRKILHKKDLKVSATCIRVPILNSHGVVTSCEFKKKIDMDKVYECLKNKEGLVLIDDINNHGYPTQIISNGNDNVYVGRIRKDLSSDNGLIFYSTLDNVRKGAASNAVEIMEKIIKEM